MQYGCGFTNPYLVNGAPIEVETKISVIYTLRSRVGNGMICSRFPTLATRDKDVARMGQPSAASCWRGPGLMAATPSIQMPAYQA